MNRSATDNLRIIPFYFLPFLIQIVINRSKFIPYTHGFTFYIRLYSYYFIFLIILLKIDFYFQTLHTYSYKSVIQKLRNKYYSHYKKVSSDKRETISRYITNYLYAVVLKPDILYTLYAICCTTYMR